MSACGDPCRLLTPLQRGFHLQVLEHVSPRKPAWKCYRDAGSAAQRGTCEAQASKWMKDPKIQAALDHHRAPAEAKVQETLEAQVARLASRARSNLADFGKLENGAFIFREGEIPREVMANALEISYDRAGNLRVKMEPRAPADSLLADILGHKAPKRHVIEDPEGELAGLLGDP